MASWTTPKTWVAASPITAAELNTHIRDNETWLKDALTTHGITSDTTIGQLESALAGVRALRTSTQSIADDTDESIHYSDADTFDSDSFHDTSTNNERITIPAGMDGYYLIGAGCEWAANATGTRRIYIEQNGYDGAGTPIEPRSRVTSDAAIVHQHVITFAQLSASDYVAATVRQTSGGALNVTDSVFWAALLFRS